MNGHAMLRTSNTCLYEVLAMSPICWEHFPLAAKDPHARVWLTMQAHLGLTPNTIHAYGYAVEDNRPFLSLMDY